MTALPHTNAEPADFRLALSDLRRMLDAAPEDQRVAIFAAGAIDVVSAWSGQMLKVDIVDGLHAVGIAVGLDVVTLQNALVDAFRPQEGGAL